MSEPIKNRRRELGMTQEQLAQMLGVSGPAVSKWEQGISYPDVTLLPALARALQTDLNTLMGFRRAPEKAEITQMLARVNDTVKAQGLEAGIALAQEILREYPDCGALLFGLAATLEGRIVFSGADRAAYDALLEGWYRRAADSADPEAGEAAAHLLASRYLAHGEIEPAQQMMNRLPKEPVSPRWPLEIALLLAKGEKQQMLARLVQAALDEGNLEQAQKLADVTRDFAELLHMHPYTGHVAQLMTALYRQDPQESVRHIRAMLDALQMSWTPGEGLLYAHSGVKKGGHADMLAGILREMRESEEYAFLQENEEFIALLADHTPDGCPRA